LDGISPDGTAHRYRHNRVTIDDVPNAQRLNFRLSLSLLDDPFAVVEKVTSKDRQRIRVRKELSEGEHRVWNQLDTDARDRARAALRILTR